MTRTQGQIILEHSLICDTWDSMMFMKIENPSLDGNATLHSFLIFVNAPTLDFSVDHLIPHCSSRVHVMQIGLIIESFKSASVLTFLVGYIAGQ